MEKTFTPSTLPKEIQELYNALYIKIEGIIAGNVIDLRKDHSTLRVIIESAMTIVEKFRNIEGQGWNGPEKKKIALNLLKYLFADLAKKGKIDQNTAKDLIDATDFWIGILMDVVIDAVKKIFDVGQEFVRDVNSFGCNEACRQNCCTIV